MQVTLAKETLSRCDGNTSVIKEQILPVNGNRRQRMTNFLRFILQDDRHVLEFEKMLTNNGLQKLLISAKSVQGDHIANEDIGRFKHVTITICKIPYVKHRCACTHKKILIKGIVNIFPFLKYFIFITLKQ